MNSFGRLPFPFDRIAKIFKLRIQKLISGSTLEFNYGFNILYGNIKGGPVVLSNAYILDYETIFFGKDVLIGPDCKLITSWHPEYDLHTVNSEPILIEDNVWLTMNNIVLAGVTISANSIFGAGSVVAKSIPPNVITAGNPARVIRERKQTR
jgi:maltose O-acetyltransferase